MQIALRFEPSESDQVNDALMTLFDLVPQVAIGSLLAYIVSQNADVYIFSKLKRKFSSDRFLWVRNNVSSMLSQLLDTAIFTVIAFWGILLTDPNVWVEIFFSTYLIKFIVAALDTPFMYLAKSSIINKKVGIKYVLTYKKTNIRIKFLLTFVFILATSNNTHYSFLNKPFFFSVIFYFYSLAISFSS